MGWRAKTWLLIFKARLSQQLSIRCVCPLEYGWSPSSLSHDEIDFSSNLAFPGLTYNEGKSPIIFMQAMFSIKKKKNTWANVTQNRRDRYNAFILLNYPTQTCVTSLVVYIYSAHRMVKSHLCMQNMCRGGGSKDEQVSWGVIQVAICNPR